MRPLLFLLAAFAIDDCSAASILNAKSEKAIPDSYIVVLKPKVSDEALASHLKWADGMLKTRSAVRKSSFAFGGFKGYHLEAGKEVAEMLAENDDVDYIEVDQKITLDVPPASKSRASRAVQTNAPWNLGRISHRARGSTEYVYTRVGGVYIYVLDSGILTSHTLFQGRAIFGYNAVGGSNTDVLGQGTYLAGITAAETYGVARGANVIGVKIWADNGSSSNSVVISAINWAVQDMKTKGRVNKSTALIAAGGGYSTAVNSAVAAATSAGLFITVPAGSDGGTGNTSPGSEPSVCLVGGTTSGDARMSASNYGPAIDIWAPGQNIVSLSSGSNTAVVTRSGTSMAAAHIAGLGAYFLALEGPRTPVALCNRLKEVATQNALSGIPPGTVNLLAYNLSGL